MPGTSISSDHVEAQFTTTDTFYLASGASPPSEDRAVDLPDPPPLPAELIEDLARLLADALIADIRLSLPFTHPGVRRTGCGHSSGAPGLGSEGHPVWTHVFRVEFQTHGGGRPRRTALTDRPPTSAWRAHPAGRKDLTPPGVCSDDGGRRPWASRRCDPGRDAPPVLAPGRPCRGRGAFGHCGSR